MATGCRPIRLATGDYIDIRLYQRSGTNSSVVDNTIWQWMTINRVTSKVGAAFTVTFDAPNATFTKVPYSTESYDELGIFDPTTNRITATAASDLQICASMALGNYSRNAELDFFRERQSRRCAGV